MQTIPFSLTPETRIGWVGVGVMGHSMCRHILAQGYPVSVYSRTKLKATPLLDDGATWVDSVAQLANECDVVFTMLGFPVDVQEVYLGSEGLLSVDKPPAIVVDMTTSEPTLARAIARQAQMKGVQALDGPVSGGDIGAQSGQLSIMLGGDSEAINQVRPLLALMGKTIIHQGEAGAGQHAKMCNQIMAAGTMIGMCESLLYGYQAGLDLDIMLQSISGGAVACWSLDNLAPRVLKGDFNPGFFVTHFIKDMGIALDEARKMSLVLPGLALVQQLYISVQAQGHGQLGTQSLMLALEQMSNLNAFSKPVLNA